MRLHVLHHASARPIYGQWMMDELSHHGYRISAGTMYPLLHGLERKGYLRARADDNGERRRRLYSITPAGRRALAAAKGKVQELFGELFEEG